MGWRVPNGILVAGLSAVLAVSCGPVANEGVSEVTTIHVTSTLDAAAQPCLFIEARGAEPRPLLVFLHTWSNGYDLDTQRWRDEAATYHWHFLQPHFRGPNTTPEACAPPVSEADMATLAREEPLPSQEEQDATFERTIYLRRYAGPCRVTIFEGGHEGLPKAALAFLARHVRE